MLASLRPPVPIFAFAPSESVVHQLALVHGVLPRLCPSSDAAASGGLELLERLLRGSRSSRLGPRRADRLDRAAGHRAQCLEVYRLP